jgi:Sap, sulfolipid-1-addressing protein
MGRLLVDLLPLTILSALTPWTIVGVIALLASKGGVTNAVAFSLGWITGILGLGGLIVVGVTAGGADHAHSVTWLQIGLQLGFGIALLVFAAGKWRARPAAGEAVAEPGWIHKLDAVRWPLAFLFGMFWINGFLVVPAALQIAAADVTGGEKAFALVFYAVGATAVPIALIAYRLAAPDRAGDRLAHLRAWLARNSTATISIIVGVIGAGLLVKAAVEIVQQL